MKKIFWLTANKYGYDLICEAKKLGLGVEGIITLKPDSKTVMYDGIEDGDWDKVGVPVYRIDRLNEEVEMLKSLNPDIIVMCGWRQIVDKEVIDIPKDGFVGFHPTLLPKGRGPAPLINTVLAGIRETGTTMFYVGEGLDDGDIIGQEKFIIDDNDHMEEIYEKETQASKELVRKYIPLLVKGEAPRVKQDESKATTYPKLSLKNNEIDLDNDSEEMIIRKIRALSKPYKGAYIKLGDKKLIIWRAELEE